MRKRFLSAALLALLLTAALGCGLLWGQKRAERETMERLCQSGAGAAADFFRQYAEEQEEYLYLYGAAEFHTFLSARLCLKEGRSDAEQSWLSAIYGQLILAPEKAQANLPKLIEALDRLSADWQDPTGYLLINELKNELLHGEEGL